MLTKIRRYLIKKLASDMPVALNITIFDGGIDMGASASISENVKFDLKKTPSKP